MSLPAVVQYRMSFGLKAALAVVLAMGALCLHLTFKESAIRGWYSYLLGSVVFLGFGLCGLFFLSVNHLVGARWNVSFRRVFEAMALTLPLAAVLGIGIYMGHHSIFEWSHTDKVAEDALLQLKSPFLNSSAFGLRLIAYFVIWILSAIYLIRNSFVQDRTMDASINLKNRRASALIIILFALSVTMAGFDLLMSLEPHWFSTMLGVHFFAALFQSGLALMIVLIWMLMRNGTLRDFVNTDHIHDMAKFLFGFSVFWGYIVFCEYMLIWYANLPEETFFYIERAKSGWFAFGAAAFVLRLVVPLFAILPFGNKRNFKILIPVCFVILAGHWIEMFWMIFPAMRLPLGIETLAAGFAWRDLGVALGFFALFVLVVGMIMERIRMIPIGDPNLEASVHHHG